MQQCFPDGKLQAEITQELHEDFKEAWNTHNFIKVHPCNNTQDKLLMFIEHTLSKIISCTAVYSMVASFLNNVLGVISFSWHVENGAWKFH